MHDRTGDERERLLAAARDAATRAYAPYSRFRVGAAVCVTTAAGAEIVTGANVENASYGLTLCAERSALAAACALADAHRPAEPDQRIAQPPIITAIALACVDAPTDAPLSLRAPCGACRQWFAELAPNAMYYIDGEATALRLADLLPNPFQLRSPTPNPGPE